ncbi:MAG: hypothetical protein ACREA9_10975 [Pyrinomonadaceae bacterium]
MKLKASNKIAIQQIINPDLSQRLCLVSSKLHSYPAAFIGQVVLGADFLSVFRSADIAQTAVRYYIGSSFRQNLEGIYRAITITAQSN